MADSIKGKKACGSLICKLIRLLLNKLEQPAPILNET